MCCTWVPDAVIQVSWSSTSWFQRRRVLKVFTIYGPGSHLGNVTQNIWTNFYSKNPMVVSYEIWHQTAQCFLKNVESEWPWTNVNKWPWPWVVKNHHELIYLTTCTNFHLTGFNSFLKIYSLSIFPYKSKRDQNWSCCKIGQCQPRAII